MGVGNYLLVMHFEKVLRQHLPPMIDQIIEQQKVLTRVGQIEGIVIVAKLSCKQLPIVGKTGV